MALSSASIANDDPAIENGIIEVLEKVLGQTCTINLLSELLLRLGNSEIGTRQLIDKLHLHTNTSSSDEIVSCRQFVEFMFEGAKNVVESDSIESCMLSRSQSRQLSRFLGVSVKHLSTTLLEEMEKDGLTRDANFHDIEPQIVLPKGAKMICPRDGEYGTSYVDALRGKDNVGRATFMLSYTWSYSIGKVADALKDYCLRENLDQSSTYVWICCFCINQHRVREARSKNVSVPFEHFKQEFADRVNEIGHIVAVMAPWEKPTYIQRVWCTFEMYCAISNESKVSITIIMPPNESSRLRVALLEPTGLDHVWRALADLKIENADASVLEDRERIFDLIREGPGFKQLNFIVRKRLQRWIIDSSEHYARACLQMNIDSANQNSVWRLCAKVGSLMREIGLLHRSSALLEEAWHAYESSRMPESSESAYLLRQWGVMKQDLGDLDAASKVFSLVHSMYERLEVIHTSNGALLFINIGSVKASCGDHIGALEMFARAEDIARSVGIFETMIGAILLRHIGASRTQLGEVTHAMEAFEKAQSIHIKTNTKDSPMSAILQRHIAEATRLNGDPGSACRILKDAMSICIVSGTLETIEGMKLMTDLGDLRHADQQLDESLECYIEAERIAKELGLDRSDSVDEARLRSRLESLRSHCASASQTL